MESLDGIVGTAPALLEALALARTFAASGLHILLVGETGTGKEVFAQAIHRWSGRPGRMVDVNCGALPRDLVEGELFGHTRGAFTGAVADRAGLLRAAAGGTLFLDEVTSLPFEAQVKLLRVLETGEVRRLGETTARSVSIQTVAAAQPDIRKRLEEGSLRRDLYQRLAGVVIHLPRLDDRREDILPLARSFAEGRGRIVGREAEEILLSQPWPGNVRELKLAIERASLLSSGVVLGREVIASAIALGSSPLFHPETRNPAGPVPEDSLRRLCRASGWRAERIASTLGVSRATLFRLLRASGVSLRRGRRSDALEGVDG
ncbi:MAG TPA: sigma 54-interacting transcriptional regulator [Gemmatimonadales bacterium]|nr:sigma 54-interacting transcriptional regulator [Gemmatimonadales bacterium]